MTPNRRQPPTDRHTLSVHLISGRLIPMCRCGATIGGQRYEDTTALSLIDLLELTRIHATDINNPRR